MLEEHHIAEPEGRTNGVSSEPGVLGPEACGAGCGWMEGALALFPKGSDSHSLAVTGFVW